MKEGDKYRCIKSYIYMGQVYYLRNQVYIINEIEAYDDSDAIKIHLSDGSLFLWLSEFREHFLKISRFKFGK